MPTAPKKPDAEKTKGKAQAKGSAKKPVKAKKPAKDSVQTPAKTKAKAKAKTKDTAKTLAVTEVRDEVKAPTREIPATPDSWNPRIVVFACNWCSYAGADTAGVSRIQHQPYFRMIRVMCSGRIQPGFVLHAFEKGADGVLVSGCHFGDCHYVFGNERAVEQFEITKNIVKLLGIEDGRLRLEWISAAEGVRFAQVINEFTDEVRKLGPSPLVSKRGAA